MSAILTLASETYERLHGHCSAIDIAGLIRLGLEPVGGFEIVCAPRIDVTIEEGFEGEAGRRTEVIPLREELRRMLGEGWAWDTARPHNSALYKRLIHRATKFSFDLFTASADAFPGLLMYRTGPLKFVAAFGAHLQRRGMSMTDGIIHRHPINKRGTSPIPCPAGTKCQGATPVKSEERLFGVVEWPYIPPSERGEWAERPSHEQR